MKLVFEISNKESLVRILNAIKSNHFVFGMCTSMYDRFAFEYQTQKPYYLYVNHTDKKVTLLPNKSVKHNEFIPATTLVEHQSTVYIGNTGQNQHMPTKVDIYKDLMNGKVQVIATDHHGDDYRLSVEQLANFKTVVLLNNGTDMVIYNVRVTLTDDCCNNFNLMVKVEQLEELVGAYEKALS